MLFCDCTLEVIGLFSILPSVYGLRRASSAARNNVIGARRRAALLKVFAMWYTWTTLLLVSCALVSAAEVGATTESVTESTTESSKPVATTRAPHRTLDRQAYELAWRSWLQSPDNGNQNAPPRRITTKSLFITPLNCDKGQRLDGNGCIQVVTVNRDEHERILLEELNARFTAAPPNDAIIYDYGEDEPGPLQLSIPIGLDPQAAPLQGQEPTGQAQELQPNFVKVKKDENKPNNDASIVAELELLQLQNSHKNPAPIDGTHILNHDVMTSFPEKPKRDTPNINETIPSTNATDEGQKELVYGHVNVDPILFKTENEYHNAETAENKKTNDTQSEQNDATSVNTTNNEQNVNATEVSSSSHILKKDGDQTKLNPENDYSDIGEAIKLISRYAEVTTDDNFTKDQKKNAMREDSVLGTRTRLQHRRVKPKLSEIVAAAPVHAPLQLGYKGQTPTHNIYPKNGVYYRYPWPSQHSPTPPPDYPFRHLQDYWPGRNQVGGVYNSHENPRRHHHSFPHNVRPHTYPLVGYPGIQEAYPEQLKGYIRRVAQHHANPMRSHTNNQDLYSLLGLRHWFSSEGTSKR